MLPKFSVKRPYTIGVGVILIIVLGFVSFMNMTTDLLPTIDLPMMIVTTAYPGASPEQVEIGVTEPLEAGLATTTGLEGIQSVSNENSSMLMLQFSETANMDATMIELSGAIDRIKGVLPEGAASPIIMKINPNMMPIMMLSVDIQQMSRQETSRYVEQEILPQFERIEGVASVTATGLVEDTVEILLDAEKIQALNNRLASNIDQTFSEQEANLNVAQNELNSAIDKLTQEKIKQVAEIEQGIIALQATKDQLEQVVEAIGVSKEVLQQQLAEMEQTIQVSEVERQVLTQQLEELPPAHPDRFEIETQLSLLDEQIKLLNMSIVRAKEGITAIDTLAELEKQEQELANAKALLSQEFDKATDELQNQQGQLVAGAEQLQSVRDKTLEGADIQGLITLDILSNMLRAQNFSMPAGSLKDNTTSYVVKVGEPLGSIEQIEQLTLFTHDVIGAVKIKDVASVTMTDNGDEIYTNINGNPGVILTFQKSSTYSTADVADAIRQQIPLFTEQNPQVTMTVLSDQGIYINLIIESVLNNLVYGGLLAVIILIIFLRSIRTTLVVALSIPISVLFAIVLMYFSDVNLNIISLSGLALGVGMLVDNSIVVVENIYRLRGEGKSVKDAAIQGASQVSGAIFASTLTTICVFLPIVFTTGMTRELFMDMGLTIGYSLIASLIVALTVVPALSGVLMRDGQATQQTTAGRFMRLYERMLIYSLKHKVLVISVVGVLFLFTLFEMTQMGTSFMPSMDSTQMTLQLTLPEDAESSTLYPLSDEVVVRLLEIEDIITVGAIQSTGMGMSVGSTRDMMLYVLLKEDKVLSNAAIAERIVEVTQDIPVLVDVSAQTMDMSALSGSGVQLTVKGPDLNELTLLAEQLALMLEEIEGTIDIKSGVEDATTELRLIVDKEKAQAYGLTVAQVYQQVANALTTEVETTPLTITDRQYPVSITKAQGVTKDTLLQHTFIVNQDGNQVQISLGEVATLETAQTLPAIARENQARYITVSAGIDAEHNIGLISREVAARLQTFQVPKGYAVELVGENEMIESAISDMVAMLAMAVLFVYLIMVAQFQSLRSPFIVMFTIPLAFTGGLLALLITRTEISVIAMLGFLVLAGIIVNNGIVFVDYVNQLKEQGVEQREALIEAGRTRMRPILMTALTTILAMSTMAIGVGMGAEMTQGLAIVTIGGLIYGTLLTLVVIPVLYDLLSGGRKKLNN